MEAAADEVVHAARAPSRRASVRTISQLVRAGGGARARRRRELRRPSEPAPARVERARAALRTASASSDSAGAARSTGCGSLELSDGLDELARRARDVAAALAVRVGDRLSTWRKLGSPWRGSGGKYVPPKNGSPVRREEDGHRPAAVPGQRDDRVHVDRVEVGPLLAVDLDVDEVLVHQPRGLGVLERLVLHHVAPVAGRVADGEQDRPVLVARSVERLVAPGVPVDGVVRVLEEVRARLVGQAVHAAPSGGAAASARARRLPRRRTRSGVRRSAASTARPRTGSRRCRPRSAASRRRDGAQVIASKVANRRQRISSGSRRRRRGLPFDRRGSKRPMMSDLSAPSGSSWHSAHVAVLAFERDEKKRIARRGRRSDARSDDVGVVALAGRRRHRRRPTMIRPRALGSPSAPRIFTSSRRDKRATDGVGYATSANRSVVGRAHRRS